MDKNIRQAIIFLLNEVNIVESWGISNIAVTPNSLEFNVSGFLYQGMIEISYSNSSYRIKLDNGFTVCCELSHLAITLDEIIEKSPNYISTLEKWLKSKL